jgi:hypothetical protein
MYFKDITTGEGLFLKVKDSLEICAVLGFLRGVE